MVLGGYLSSLSFHYLSVPILIYRLDYFANGIGPFMHGLSLFLTQWVVAALPSRPAVLIAASLAA